MYRSEVVGFDVREMWLNVASQWTQAKKDALLLRHDILKPLSVDKYVWYSVFSELRQPQLWNSILRQPKYSGSEYDNIFMESRKLSAPDNYRPRGVWRNLTSLREYLQKSWGDIWKPSFLVAIVEIISDQIEKDEKYEGPDSISPDVIDKQWQLLGYDVADYELITGLFNGAMEPNEAIKLRHEWKDHLNEYHLFVEPQKAFEYIAVANLKYPSHVPYYVYALYGIQEKQTF